MKISLLVPSRGRPKQMQRIWDSAIKTAKEPQKLEIVFRVDIDDPTVDPNTILEFLPFRNQTQIIVGPRLINNGAQLWNEIYNFCTGEIIMLAADDIIFHTLRWDERVREEFLKYNDRIVYIAPFDGYQDRWGTHGFIHSNWIETVGYFTPPELIFYGIDTWLQSVASELGRYVMLRDVLVEHRHWLHYKRKIKLASDVESNDPVTYDNTYKFRAASMVDSNKQWRKLRESDNGIWRDIKKLEEFIKTY